MPRRDKRGPDMSKEREMGMGETYAPGPRGKCLCPSCGFEQPHIRATPCVEIPCPKCGTLLERV